MNNDPMETRDLYTELAEKIIKEQEGIIGPVAYEQARKVPGLSVEKDTQVVHLEGNKKEIIENLVKKYEELFGMTSIEVCREAVRDLVAKTPKDQIPQLLV